jgi:hypothetical protein
VTRCPPAQRIAEHLIRRACRRLPRDLRDERDREWAAELPTIISDPDIRFAFLRSARALRYAAGVYRATRHLPRAARAPAWGTRQPTIFPRPGGVIPAIAAVIAWLAVIGLARAFPPAGPWTWLILPIALLPPTLAVIAIVRFVRWCRRRSRQTPRP